jgi:hypothetical protein
LERLQFVVEVGELPVAAALLVTLSKLAEEAISFLGDIGERHPGVAKLWSKTIDVGELKRATCSVGGLAFGVVGPSPCPAAPSAGFAATGRPAAGLTSHGVGDSGKSGNVPSTAGRRFGPLDGVVGRWAR